MDRLLQDLAYALRRLRQAPAFTFVAGTTLALGIGAASAIFSVVYGVLLRPLPYPKPDQIVRLWELDETGRRMSFADPNFEDVKAESRSFDGMAEYGSSTESVLGGAEPTRAVVAAVSADFLGVLGVRPVVGRAFSPDEQRSGGPAVALVSHEYWTRSLGGAMPLSSIRLSSGNQPWTVVGVLPAGFRFPDDAEIWIPREIYGRTPSRTAHNWRVVARLRDWVGLTAARTELSTLARRLQRQHGADTTMADIAAAPLREAMTGRVSAALWIVLGASGSLLLIAIANVANLLLAQAATRTRELAVRAALGAARAHLVRQLLTEALLLSLGAGALGVWVAVWGITALRRLAPATLPRLDEIAVNWPVLLFALAVSLAVAGALGALTAWRATASDPQAGLAQATRGEAGTARTQRLGRLMVSGQLAITLVLLAGAGLLGRSLLSALSVHPGFDQTRIVTMELALPSADDEAKRAVRAQFLSSLVAAAGALPGVLQAGGTNALPLASGGSNGTFAELSPQQAAPATIEEVGRLFRSGGPTGEADYRVVSEGYFSTLRIPLREGRFLGESDTREAPHAAVVSESLARRQWPGQSALGRRLEFGNMDGDLRPLVVVGVVGDVRPDSLEGPPRPTIYLDHRQRPRRTTSFTLVLRTDGDPAAVAGASREILRRLDPTVPPRFRTYADVVSSSLGQRRFDLTLVGVFACTALLLALAGVYGVTAYWVAQRTREIGVRMALGARGDDIVRLVLSQGMRAVAIGVGVGLGGALLLARAMESMVFGVSGRDPATLGAVTVVLALVAALASYLPARRAMRVDPMVALRAE